MSANQPSLFCRFPFFNLMFTSTGEYAVCCKYKYPLATNGTVLSTTLHSLEEAWQSDTLRQVRQDFLNGQMPEGCEKCRLEEASGIQSTRQHSFDYAVSEQQLNEHLKPTRLEIYPGNLCNLKCRICFATNSTQWIQEAKDEFAYQAQEHFLLTPPIMQALNKWLPNITELTFAGGEPFLYKEFEQLLDQCIESGRAAAISLLINTNATIYKQAIIDKLKQFKRVVLTLSIDDTGERFAYQRSGANWVQVARNLALYQANCGIHTGNRIVCHICCTVSNLNIFYLPETLHWFSEQLPDMLVYLNVLHQKELFCIRNLPQPVKEITAEKLKALQDDTRLNLDTPKRTLTDIIAFMQLAPDTPFGDFIKEIKRSDRYLKKDFAAIFSEYWRLIAHYENL